MLACRMSRLGAIVFSGLSVEFQNCAEPYCRPQRGPSEHSLRQSSVYIFNLAMKDAIGSLKIAVWSVITLNLYIVCARSLDYPGRRRGGGTISSVTFFEDCVQLFVGLCVRTQHLKSPSQLQNKSNLTSIQPKTSDLLSFTAQKEVM